MYIETMPDVLSWSPSPEILDNVHRSYVALLKQRWAADETRLGVPSASVPEALLTAPEVSFRLLETPGTTESVEFLHRALEAEAARHLDAPAFPRVTWTALGDVCFTAGGRVLRYPRLSCGLPLDFGSPHTAHVDFGGLGNSPNEHREPFSSEQLALVVERLESATAGIGRSDPAILRFVAKFNKVLICQKDPAAPTAFSSGSTGQYVGRSFVTNPHLPAVDEVDLAEALVHEGIHSLLYMQERCRPWIHDPASDRPLPLIISPWSGNRLSIRSYLQAAFVWYGLANFWAVALIAQAFDGQRIRQRLSVAARGFLGDSVAARLAPYAGVSPDLIAAIEKMQATLTEIFAEVGMART